MNMRKESRIKLKHGIWYNPKTDSYVIRGQSGKTYAFPSMDDAEFFYESIKQERLQRKIAEEKESIKASDDKLISDYEPFPFNAAKAAGLDDSTDPDFLNRPEDYLSPNEAKFLLSYYRDGLNLREISEIHKLSKARVGQIIKLALRKTYLKVKKEQGDARTKERLEILERDRQDLNAYRAQLIEIFKSKGIYGEDMEIEFGPVTSKRKSILGIESEVLSRRTDRLGLSMRSANCLRRAGITTVGELISKTEPEIMRIRNLGKKSFIEIKERLRQLGLSLKEDA